MSCHLMWWSCQLMRCDCLCCVMSRDAAQCPGDELVPVVTCNAMECYELKMPLVVITLYSSTSLYYKVLHQYYSSTTTSVLLCITKYYNVLLQYYSAALHRTTPVLLGTTKYYSSTTLYYKVLVQYYKLLQSTTLHYKVLLQYYSVQEGSTHDWCLTHSMNRYLHCAEQQKSSSNFTKYCACHAK